MAFTRLEPTGINIAATFTFANVVTSDLNATGNVNLGSISNLKISGGTADYFLKTDGSGSLSWAAVSGGGGTNNISNGTSNVSIDTINSNVTISVGGTSNIISASTLGATVTGYVTASGNISAPYFIGNGALLTGISGGSSYANANVASYLPTYTGNVSANYFIGNGSQLTGLPASYSNANVASYLPTFTGNIAGGNINVTGNVSANYFLGNATRAGTVTTAAQPNITSVGTLTSLSVTGLVTAGNIKTSSIQDTTGTTTIQTKYNNKVGDVGITGNLVVGTGGAGNVTATYFIGDGSQLTGISGGGWSASFAKNYYWQGPIQVNTGTQRLYVPANSTVTKASFNLVTAGTTDTVVVTKKNGTAIDTTTMGNGVSNTTSTLSASLTLTDYLTVDIPTAGASAIGLYVTYLLVPN